jgi:hypothetical protein
LSFFKQKQVSIDVKWKEVNFGLVISRYGHFLLRMFGIILLKKVRFFFVSNLFILRLTLKNMKKKKLTRSSSCSFEIRNFHFFGSVPNLATLLVSTIGRNFNENLTIQPETK